MGGADWGEGVLGIDGLRSLHYSLVKQKRKEQRETKRGEQRGREHEGRRKGGRKEKREERGRRTYPEFTGTLRFRGSLLAR